MTRKALTSLLAAALFPFANATLAGASPAPMRIACIGDSITFGAGIEGRENNSFPAQLGTMLGKTYEVKNFGVSASTLLKKGNKPYWRRPQFKAAEALIADLSVRPAFLAGQAKSP